MPMEQYCGFEPAIEFAGISSICLVYQTVYHTKQNRFRRVLKLELHKASNRTGTDTWTLEISRFG